MTSSFSLTPTRKTVATRASSNINNNAPKITKKNRDESRNQRDLLVSMAKPTERREILGMLAMVGVAKLSTTPRPAYAASDYKAGTQWLTGKMPVIPGEKPRDPKDTKGTKKDPNFLRSISDCKSQCENTPGPDGYSRAKEDCLSDCQDICCSTYQQCTFSIIPR
eukprot:CAMPEP_0195521056 /NCGR_PEP_ID=MMETSP0794_2-20130614/17864_1 /TAXON_ID=515487 /ORGANISM="Stephanopyxis turris, Strain CCMP 815" /LENGTH=164 /DNA_ID=CAMNT_0040650517 /DNA_START=179 /DNA_END=673 /DNA_ORIENTATION=-